MSCIAIAYLSLKALPNEIAFAGKRHRGMDAASAKGMLLGFALVGMPARPALWT